MNAVRERFLVDAGRVLALAAIGSLFLICDERIALAMHLPAMAPFLMWAGLGLYGAALALVLLRIYFPYMDGRPVFAKAVEHPIGAGLVFLARAVVLASLLLTLPSVVKAQDLPERAHQYIPVLKAEQQRWWPDMAQPALFAAQVEKETCITLKHRMCWSPRAELRTSRERGVGLGQITAAFRADGSTRFDALAEMRASTGAALDGMRWEDDSIYDPALQLRALVLKDLQNWRAVGRQAASQRDGFAFMLAGYNGGLGGVMSDQKLCGGTRGCDKTRWYGHVEHTSLKTKVALKGYGQSFFQINRGYVAQVQGPRLARYQGLL